MPHQWLCQKVDADGNRCAKTAVHRLHFSKDHPFDFLDVCETHLDEYTDYLWVQYMKEVETWAKEYEDGRRKSESAISGEGEGDGSK